MVGEIIKDPESIWLLYNGVPQTSPQKKKNMSRFIDSVSMQRVVRDYSQEDRYNVIIMVQVKR